jgi:hypothetical protein
VSSDTLAGARAATAAFADALKTQLRGDLLGVYLVGSATHEDFEPATSDLDIYVVLRRPPGVAELDILRAAVAANAYGHRFELECLGVEQLRPWGVEGDVIDVSPAAPPRIAVSRSGADDILGARASGLAVYGPPPEDVFPPVDAQTLRAEFDEYLADLATRHSTRREAPPEELARWTLNAARCAFGIRHGRLATKSEAARWLMELDPSLERVVASALAARRGDPAAARVAADEYPAFVRRVLELARL